MRIRYYNNAVFDRLELKGRIGVGGSCGRVNIRGRMWLEGNGCGVERGKGERGGKILYALYIILFRGIAQFASEV